MDPKKRLFASLKPQLWQWQAAIGGQSAAAQFRLIEAPSRASAARNSSSSIADSVLRDLRPRLRRPGAAGARPIPARQRGLPQRQPAHRAPAEEAVDALQDNVGGVLDFQRHRALHPQHQRGRFLRLAFHRPRPLDLQRFGMRAILRAGDFRPARDQFARGKALLGIGVGKHVAEQDGKRLGEDRTGLGHVCFIPSGRFPVTYLSGVSVASSGTAIRRMT